MVKDCKFELATASKGQEAPHSSFYEPIFQSSVSSCSQVFVSLCKVVDLQFSSLSRDVVGGFNVILICDCEDYKVTQQPSKEL